MDTELENKFKKHHTELWDWLSKNPTAIKLDWPGWSHNGGNTPMVQDSCFACEAAIINNSTWNGPSCGFCPLDKQACKDSDSWFNTWRRSKDTVTKVSLAKKIRDSWIGFKRTFLKFKHFDNWYIVDQQGRIKTGGATFHGEVFLGGSKHGNTPRPTITLQQAFENPKLLNGCLVHSKNGGYFTVWGGQHKGKIPRISNANIYETEV